MVYSEFKHNILTFLESNPQVNRLCVAYSGGLDSSVLLHLSYQLCHELQRSNLKEITIKALHVNHGLSKNANAWQQHCQNVCDSYSCEFVAHTVTIDKKANIEKQAREKRYQFFQAQCVEYDVLLMAHHANDQTETLLFRFFRGGSSKALMGIPAQRALHKKTQIQLLRPLLNINKEQLREYALLENLSWVEDESNRDKKYARNFIRQQLVPSIREYWPEIDNNLSNSARFFSETETLLADLANIDLANVLNTHDILIKWGEHLAVKPFSQLSLARKKNVLRFWLQKKDIDLPPENRLLELIAFTDDVKRESAGEFSWKQHDCEIVFRVFDGHLFFHQYPVLKPEFKDFQWNLSTQDYFDCGGYRYRALTALKEKISQVDVRFRKGGERCQPVGRAHSQTLKKLFQEFHIPPWERDNAPIFYINNTMIAVADFWVCEGFSDKHKQVFLIEKTCLGINA